MQLATYGIVVASTVTHAYWNFLIKRSGGGQVSVVYPVARGGTLLFLPVFGFAAFGERLSALGLVAVGSIVLGIVVLQLSALTRAALSGLVSHLTSAPVAFALIAALAAAGYAIWDKRAVQTLQPFLYFYAYSALVAVAYGAFLVRQYPRAALRAEWSAHRSPILQVAVLNTVTYVLVLFALRTGASTYVVAVRQLSIAVGAVLAWRVLGETFGAPRRLGVTLVVVGCVLVAMAR